MKRDAQDMRERRDTRFEVPNTSNFGLRTVVRLARPACRAVLLVSLTIHERRMKTG